MKDGWDAIMLDGYAQIHVLPVNDAGKHNHNTMDCPCGPRVCRREDGIFIVTHKSYDRREFLEEDTDAVFN